jgi:site-specific DNA-methyltransferase (adenine-specific)
MNSILLGDCLETMKTLADNSVDAIVTDPPYGLSFMGKKWDYDVPSVEIWKECLRVLKPGGYLLSFAGTRTQHRMAVRIEDAGFEIRDMIAWVYGSGFPKSLNIGKAVDKIQGSERVVLPNPKAKQQTQSKDGIYGDYEATTTISKGTSEWEGWGTALKPALEPITVARKPISEKTVAENCLKWGVGGINIDGSRVESNEDMSAIKAFGSMPENKADGNGFSRPWMSDKQSILDKQNAAIDKMKNLGRFPANLIHDGSEEVVGMFPNNSQRFFYSPKASRSERNEGCEGLEGKTGAELTGRKEGSAGMSGSEEHGNSTNPFANSGSVLPSKNFHPTVKPIALMEYLVNLVSRNGAVVLDPFAGSGSTLIACKKLGRQYIGCEMSEEYVKIAEARLSSISAEQQNLL